MPGLPGMTAWRIAGPPGTGPHCRGIDDGLTIAVDTARMSEAARTDKPLASYVLRIRGQPATLRFELDDLRTGDRRVFLGIDRLVAFLREHGLGLDGIEAAERPQGDE
jgi:hypothetical protein